MTTKHAIEIEAILSTSIPCLNNVINIQQYQNKTCQIFSWQFDLLFVVIFIYIRLFLSSFK